MSKKHKNKLRIICDRDDPTKYRVFIDHKEVHGVKDYNVDNNDWGSYARIEFYPSEVSIEMVKDIEKEGKS